MVSKTTPYRLFLAALAIVALTAAVLGLTRRNASPAPITIFAAASLKTALDEIGAAYQLRTGQPVTLSYAGSAILARQIQQGAPADLFLSASPDWMGVLERENLVRAGSRVDLLGNRLALIGSGQTDPIDLSAQTDLAALLGNNRLALALTSGVPAGVYAKQALVSLGLWDSLAGKTAETDNVRAALALVALGEAPLGITYVTDANAEPAVSLLAIFPEDSHDPIVYPAAIMGRSTIAEAESFLSFLTGEFARKTFEQAGFTILAGAK